MSSEWIFMNCCNIIGIDHFSLNVGTRWFPPLSHLLSHLLKPFLTFIFKKIGEVVMIGLNYVQQFNDMEGQKMGCHVTWVILSFNTCLYRIVYNAWRSWLRSEGELISGNRNCGHTRVAFADRHLHARVWTSIQKNMHSQKEVATV